MKKIKTMLLLIGCLTLVTSLISIFNSDVYMNFVDPDYISESVGQDIVSVLAAIFIIFIGMRFERASTRLKLSGLGLLFYLAYAYAIYAFGSVYNFLFFNYIAIMGLCVFCGFMMSIESVLEIQRMKTSKKYQMSKDSKGIAMFFLITSLMLGFIWVSSVLSHIIDQTVARETVIYVIDLSVVLPLFAITGISLFQKKSEGWYLAVILMVKALTIGLSIISGQLVKYIKGYDLDLFLVVLFGIFTLIALWLNITMKPRLKKGNR